MNKLLTIALMAGFLSACGAQPLRSTEEATADAIMEASNSAEEVEKQSEEVAEEAATVVVNTAEFAVLTDSITGCEYLSAPSGLTPRMAFHSKSNAKGYLYKHLGCTEK